MSRQAWGWAVGVAVCVAAFAPSWAQEEDAEGALEQLNVAYVESRVAQLDDLALSEEQRQEARQTYAQVLSELSHMERLRTREEEFEARASSAEERLGEVREALRALPVSDRYTLEAAPEELAEVEAGASVAEQTLQDARAAVEQLQVEVSRRTERRAELAQRVVEAQTELQELRGALAERDAADGENAEVQAARRLRLLAHRERLRQEIATHEAELVSFEARRELLPARLDLAIRERELAEAEFEAWQERAAELRWEDVDRTSRAADDFVAAAEGAPPLEALAETIEDLAAEREGEYGLSGRLVEAADDLGRRRRQLSELRGQFRLIQRKVQAAGVTRAMGRLLRLQLDRLYDTGALRAEIERLQGQISEAQFRLIVLEEERREAARPGQRLEELLAALPEAEREGRRALAERMLTAHVELIDTAIDDHALLVDRLVALKGLTAQVADASDEFRGYIQERILWVRSLEQVHPSLLADVPDALAWFVHGGNWSTCWSRCVREAEAGWWWLVGWAVVAGALPVVAVVGSRRDRRQRAQVWDPESDALGRTWAALAVCVARSGWWPWWLIGAAHLLWAPHDQLLVAKTTALGLATLGWGGWCLGLVASVLRPEGPAQVHWRWRPRTCAHLRRQVLRFGPAYVAAGCLVATMERQSEIRFSDSLGLLAFLVQAVALGGLLVGALRIGAPPARAHLQRHGRGWVRRLRWLVTPALVAVPSGLWVLALSGYYYSAVTLAERVEESAVLGLGLLGVHAMLWRWTALVRLRLVSGQLRALEEEGALESKGDSPQERRDHRRELARELQRRSPGVDVASRRLFRSGLLALALLGLAWVWSGVVPALKRLQRIQVYPEWRELPEVAPRDRFPTLRGEEGAPAEAEEGGGEPAAEPSPSLGPAGLSTGSTSGGGSEQALPQRLTLAELGLALVVLAVTVMLAGNLPHLLEIALLERLPLDTGARYAIATVARYTVVLVGGTIVLRKLGIGWSNVQWLAAALTFGLAFGLQEIFANFVSGLIILAERPVRVGDVVTVKDVSGTVTRIRMRATTIRDWDDKELVIPNKEFVTGQVINWSLSNARTRLTLVVGVAYGSDVDEAHRVLLRVLREHPEVLGEPEPTAWFEEFAASSLNFTLRFFVGHVDERLRVRHEILVGVERALTEAGIVIAFPQRDVHLKPDPALVEALRGDPARGDSARGGGVLPDQVLDAGPGLPQDRRADAGDAVDREQPRHADDARGDAADQQGQDHDRHPHAHGRRRATADGGAGDTPEADGEADGE